MLGSDDRDFPDTVCHGVSQAGFSHTAVAWGSMGGIKEVMKFSQRAATWDSAAPFKLVQLHTGQSTEKQASHAGGPCHMQKEG